jgi:nitrogen PTS system EIIA component
MILSELEPEVQKESVLEEYIDRELITFTPPTTRDEVIKELAALLENQDKIHSKELFIQSVMEREKLVTTGIGYGIAIPHAKHDVYEEFSIALALSKKEIEWDTIDGNAVHLVFLIAGPEKDTKKYLQILSQITHFLKDEERRAKLTELADVEEVVKLFEGW